MTTSPDTRRIYVACLAAYNAGIPHGAWIDIDGADVDDVRGAIAAMLRASPRPNVTVPNPDDGGATRVPSAEEYAVHAYDGFPPSIAAALGEYPDVGRLLMHAEQLDEHGDAWVAYVDCVGERYATADNFTDDYAGEYESEAHWAEEYIADQGVLSEAPELLRTYFDYEAFARDARLNGDVGFVRIDGTMYAFWNH